MAYTDHMAQSTSPIPIVSVDEYLDAEERSPIKHEYVGGLLYALAETSARHNKIVGRLYRLLIDAATVQACDVLFSDVKAQVTDTVFYYPDLMVVCDPDDRHPLYRKNPRVVIEVLSPSTEAYDRREKVFMYRQVPALQAYMILFQDQKRLQRHYRDARGSWRNAEVYGDGLVPFPCPDITLSLNDIYRGIDLSEE